MAVEVAPITARALKAGIVKDPRLWATSAGYEFQAVFGHADIAAALSATNDGISGYGWTLSGPPTITEGSTGDFLSSADIDPTYMAFNAFAFNSPTVFGSYAHSLQASRFLGNIPTRLCYEVLAQFSTVSNNNNGTFFGLTVGSTAASGAGSIWSDATNFICGHGSASDTGAAVDTNWHLWKVVVDVSNVEWFIDGASQGTFASKTDVWPIAFKVLNDLNAVRIANLRIWYE